MLGVGERLVFGPSESVKRSFEEVGDKGLLSLKML